MKCYFIIYFVLLLSLNFIEGAFRCDYKYSSKSQAWFKFHIIPATWFDARLRCSLEGAVLASPITPDILAEMRNIINTSNPEYEIFTGIHATFSQGDYYTIEGNRIIEAYLESRVQENGPAILITGTPLSEIQVTWAENEPDNKDNGESCMTLNGFGELADRRCEETRPYICYRPERLQLVSECGTIDPEYTLDRRTNKCYKLHTVARNYSRAFMTCSAEGGHLAIINSAVEATVLKELFAKYPESKMLGAFRKDVAFIGLHDSGETWDWKTIHGQTLSEAGYSIYSKGEPNNMAPGQSCGGIYRSSVLVDLWCHAPVVFICEKNPGPTICRALTENTQ